jgi:hypothetical protein
MKLASWQQFQSSFPAPDSADLQALLVGASPHVSPLDELETK